MIKKIVADAGLLDPTAGTVGLDRFQVDLWVAYRLTEVDMAAAHGPRLIRAVNRGATVGTAMAYLSRENPGITKDDVLFLVRRKTFVGAFTAGQGTTCGEWTPVVNRKGQKGFFKAGAASGWCPARCKFCYLLRLPWRVQALALNVGDFARQVARERQIGRRRSRIPTVNLGETGGLLEWASEYKAPEIVQAYVDAALSAGVTPYLLTKRAVPGLKLRGAHVGVSLNPISIMARQSPGASPPAELLDFLADAKTQGASTVIRWGPVFPGHEKDYEALAQLVYDRGLADRFTVDLLRFTDGHQATPSGFVYRAHKWQEPTRVQEAHLHWMRQTFPHAIITGCKLDPRAALPWVRWKLIQAMPCACWP